LRKVQDFVGGKAAIDAVQAVRATGSMNVRTPQGPMDIDVDQLTRYPDSHRNVMKTPMGEMPPSKNKIGLVGALGAVQLPPSLSTLLGGGGGGAAAVAGGGAVAGSGLLAKAALLVATGLVAGTVGTTVDAKLAAPAPQAAVVAPAPLVVRAATPVSFRVAKTDEIRTRRASERLPSIRWVRSSSSTRKAPAGGSGIPGASGSSQQEVTGGAAEAGTAAAAPAAPTASVEPSSANSTVNQTSSAVTQTTSDVTSQTGAVTSSLPPVPPPPPLPDLP